MARSSLPLLCIAWAILATAGPAGGQAVRIQVLAAESREPIPTAFVSLLDEADRPVRQGLTSQDGRAVLNAPGPGVYRLRAEMLGRATESSQPFHLRPDSTLVYRFELPAQAILLSEIRVESERQCRVRPEDGAEMARVWEEARKALSVQAWGEDAGIHSFRIDSWERTLSRDGSEVVSESYLGSSVTSGNPIRSLPVEEILERGFVQDRGNGRVEYFGPDASVLLSDLFLNTHCFRLAQDEGRPEEIGLAFEPEREAREESVPDIRGTLWLDRLTGGLRLLEFRYTDLEELTHRGLAGGRVEFDRLPDGLWIVRKWQIRVPMVRRSSLDGVLRIVGIREASQEVVDLMENGRPGFPGRPLFLLRAEAR